MDTPPVDFDGEPRPDPVFGIIDIGADEYYGNLPAAPEALTSPENGCDYFVALWHETILASGYYLDVAYDSNFLNILPDYNGFDVGEDTSYQVENLQVGMLHYYRVTAYNEWGISDYSNTIEVDLCVGIDESITQYSALNIQHYPNPTSGIYNLQFTIYSLQSVSCKIYDMHGREVSTVLDQKLPAGEHVVQYDMSALPEGLYLVTASTATESYTKKLIKIR
jgi:hypothetical protein